MVFSLSWFALAAVTSGRTWHHGVESPSLLQSVVSDRPHHRHHGKGLPALSHIQSHNSLESIEKYASELEAQARNASPNATNFLTTDELKMLLDLITAMDAEFVVELVKQSDADKEAYLVKKAAHEACYSHLQKRLALDSGDVWKAEQQISTRRAKHKACRRAEKSLLGYTDKATPVGGGVWGNLARVPGQTQLSEHESLCTSQATFVSDLSAYEDRVPTGTISASCGEDQMQLETGMCKWLEGKTYACIGFDECLVSVGLTTLKSETEASSTNRKAVFLSIEKLKCRLQHLYDAFLGGASSFTTTDTCGNTPDPEPTKFTLTLEVPTYVGCSGDTDIVNPVQPSTEFDATCDDWRQQEFNADENVSHTYDLEHHTPVAICKTSCELPTQVGSAIIAQGCVDRNDVGKQCPFYNVHFDACLLYSDNATSICCACGGGINPCDAIQDCSGHGTTSDMDNLDGCECTCTDGYTGTSCATPPMCDAAQDCSGHGTTDDMDSTDGCECTCTDDFTGPNCATPPPCDPTNHCSGHGTTSDMDHTDGCVCVCTDGFTGPSCATPTKCEASQDCSGHGTTNDMDNTDGCECTCTSGFTGPSCATPPPCNSTTHCSGHGTSDMDHTDGCVCAPKCEASQDCSGHGTTNDMDSTDGCKCTCTAGFTGPSCATPPKK